MPAAGNAGQSKASPLGVVASTGAQFITPSSLPEVDQTPGAPTPLGSFNITQVPPTTLDKATKDNNYRGITINDNVSDGGDQGADPDKLVEITDRVDSTDPATANDERFHTIKTTHFGEVLRGVSFTPGTAMDLGWGDHER